MKYMLLTGVVTGVATATAAATLLELQSLPSAGSHDPHT